MPFSLSPAVNVSEYDLTTVVPAVATTNAALVGNFVWGPAYVRTLIDSETTLVNRFGRPDSNSAISFFTAANFLAYGNNLRVIRQVGANANNSTSGGLGLQVRNEDDYFNSYYNFQAASNVGEFAARYPGALGNSIRVATCPSANAFSLNLTSGLGVTATINAGSALVQFTANVAGFVVPGDILNVSGTEVLVVNVATANVTVNTGTLFTANTNGVSTTRRWFWSSYFNGPPGTSAYAAQVGGVNDEKHLIVIDEDGLFSAGQGGANTVLEVYPYLSKAIDARNPDGSGNFGRDVIYNKSKYIYKMRLPAEGTNWGNVAAGTTFTNINFNRYLPLAGGVDAAPSQGDLLLGWDKFANPEEVDVSLLLGADSNPVVSTYIIQNVAEKRLDAVAFVSPMSANVVNQLGSEVTNLQALRNALPSSSYAVLDGNWKYQFDKYNNIYRWLPLNGDLAGLCARTDNEFDPWWSPAGFNRGRIKNVVKLAWNPTKTGRDELYKVGINPVVAFPGEGPVLYGDKTLQTKPSAFDRINVRRLFIVLEKAIATAAKYSLFEFNDEFTRTQFVSLIEPYLRDIKGRRGIYDYRVVCDETNNTPQVIDTNQFIGDIYIKPARSINFIQLNFVAVRTGVSFEEVVGKF